MYRNTMKTKLNLKSTLNYLLEIVIVSIVSISISKQLKINICLIDCKGGIPQTAHGAKIPSPPPPLFFFVVFMLILTQVRLSQSQACPVGLGKKFHQVPSVLVPPAGARIKKTKKQKIKGGVNCAPRAKHGIVPL